MSNRNVHLRTFSAALWAVIILADGAAPALAQAQYRKVGGKVVPRNSRDWTVMRDRIEVTGPVNEGLVCREFVEEAVPVGSEKVAGSKHGLTQTVTRTVRRYRESFILMNYPGGLGLKRGDIIQPPISVMRVGASGSLMKYDYGVDCAPPAQKLTPEQAKAAQAQTAKGNSSAEAAKLKFEEEQAEEGKDLYQYRLGMRYLKGDGVPTDRAKALDYLAKSAAQGNHDAEKELAKLRKATAETEADRSTAAAK
jgi:hypothetical protein